MAKSLREPPPTSSVARLLDPQAASRAIAAPQSLPVRADGDSDNDGHAASVLIKRELTFSRATDEAFTSLIDAYRRATGTRMTASHVARAIMKGIAFCLPELEHEARRIGRVKLPSNARGRTAERENFEDRIAEAFVNGVRSAAAYRS